MIQTLPENTNIGFWIRLKAIWLDTLIVIVMVNFLIFVLQPPEYYIPYELTSIILGIVYASLFTWWRGYTIGKKLCGLRIVKTDEQKPGFIRVFLRESIAKLISTLFLFSGFIWIGLSKNKRALHDLLCGTQVVRIRQKGPSRFITLLIPLTLTLFLIRGFIADSFTLYPQAIAYKRRTYIPPQYEKREALPTEVSSIALQQDTLFVNWLNTHAMPAEEFAIELAKEHQLTLFGELHNQLDNLDFLKKIIPDLYFKSGVRCIGMECIPHEMNNKVRKLVTANKYDDELALEIARSQGWGLWGDKEYWDILRAVWELNRSVKGDKMEVVGIDSKYDMPSIALLGVGDAPLSSPWWEKLRVIRAPVNLLKIELLRDEIMAVNIEREIMSKKKKAIVLVGAEHAHINYAPVRQGHFFYRMAYLLHAKYGDIVTEVSLHRMYFPAGGDWDKPQLGKFIDRIMKERGNKTAGISLKNSPFGSLRDSAILEFADQPRANFYDIATNYIFLNSNDRHGNTHWTKGYISKKMFMDNKPFYESFWQRKMSEGQDREKWKNVHIKFKNAKATDDFIKKLWESN